MFWFMFWDWVLTMDDAAWAHANDDTIMFAAADPWTLPQDIRNMLGK